jgi:hypothetical protein
VLAVKAVPLLRQLQGLPQLQQQLAAAVVAAVPGCEVQHLVAVALAVPDLPDAQQAAIAKAAAGLQEAPGNAASAVPLLQQLQGLPELQQQLAAAAVAAMSDRGVQHFVALALAVPNLPAVQQSAVAKAAAALQAGIADATTAVPLLQQLQALPEVQQQLAAAAGEALLGSQVQQLVELALAVPDLPALQQAAVSKAAAAIQACVTGALAVTAAPLLQQLQALPQLRQQLAAAAVAGLCSAGPSRHFSTAALLLQSCKGQQLTTPREQLLGRIGSDLASGYAADWQATELQKLLQATPAETGAHATLLAAAMQGMFDSSGSAALLSRQSDESMLVVSQLLLGAAGLADRCYPRFATAVAQRRSNYSLLKQLLQTAAMRAVLELPGVQQLVVCQIANLQRKAAVPQFSWDMPQASVPRFPQVGLLFFPASE